LCIYSIYLQKIAAYTKSKAKITIRKLFKIQLNVENSVESVEKCPKIKVFGDV